MSEASSPQVLGLVPVVGREALAYLAYKRSTLVSGAVEALCPVADHVMVVTADGQADKARGALAHLDIEGQGCFPGAAIGSFAAIEVPREEALARTVAESADVVVVHDPLCPGVSTASLQRLLELWSPGTVTVAVRPVVDTVKVVADGVVTGTLNREDLRMIGSPVVMPADRMAAIPRLGAKLADLASLVATLRGVCEVVLVPGDPAAGRVEDPSSIPLLTALDALHELDC